MANDVRGMSTSNLASPRLFLLLTSLSVGVGASACTAETSPPVDVGIAGEVRPRAAHHDDPDEGGQLQQAPDEGVQLLDDPDEGGQGSIAPAACEPRSVANPRGPCAKPAARAKTPATPQPSSPPSL